MLGRVSAGPGGGGHLQRVELVHNSEDVLCSETMESEAVARWSNEWEGELPNW
jgi:hypothetical protein